MRQLAIALFLLAAGCSKPSVKSGVHRESPERLESAVPNALVSELRLADSIYLTSDQLVGERYESRVSQELRAGHDQPLVLGEIHRSEPTLPKASYPEQSLILRYFPGWIAGKDGERIVARSYSIYSGVLHYDNLAVPVDLVLRWIAQNPAKQLPDGGPPGLINDIEPTIILAVIEGPADEPAETPERKPSGLVLFHLEGDQVPGQGRRIMVVGDGPVVPNFRDQLAADERLIKANANFVLLMNCQRQGDATDLAKVKRIRFVVNNKAVKGYQGQVAVVEMIEGIPTLTFLMEQDSTLWKHVNAGVSVALDQAAK